MSEEKWWKSFIRTRLKIFPSRIHEDEKEEITLTADEERMCANSGIPEEEWIKGKKRVLDEEKK
jgi:alpha-galactosidase/6-phospho-beta-glucosidase family protein